MEYNFDDFYTDMKNDWSSIEDGGKARKIEISILNPLVPMECKNRIAELLKDFIKKHNIREPLENIEWISGIVSAFIDKNVKPEEKYFLSLLTSVKEDGKQKSDIVTEPILPTDDYFAEFKQCVMAELENMIFGDVGTDLEV